jgi:serine/threonine protein kinase
LAFGKENTQLFSTGILVYEMHAGFTPWHGNNALEVYDKILDAKLKFPKSFNLIAR